MEWGGRVVLALHSGTYPPSLRSGLAAGMERCIILVVLSPQIVSPITRHLVQ